LTAAVEGKGMAGRESAHRPGALPRHALEMSKKSVGVHCLPVSGVSHARFAPAPRLLARRVGSRKRTRRVLLLYFQRCITGEIIPFRPAPRFRVPTSRRLVAGRTLRRHRAAKWGAKAHGSGARWSKVSFRAFSARVTRWMGKYAVDLSLARARFCFDPEELAASWTHQEEMAARIRGISRTRSYARIRALLPICTLEMADEPNRRGVAASGDVQF